jgi:hypothetical protein
MDKAGPVIGIALLVALGAGVYAMMLRGEVDQEKQAVAVMQRNLNDAKRIADDEGKQAATINASLSTCTAQLNDAQTKLAAKTAGKTAHR